MVPSAAKVTSLSKALIANRARAVTPAIWFLLVDPQRPYFEAGENGDAAAQQQPHKQAPVFEN